MKRIGVKTNENQLDVIMEYMVKKTGKIFIQKRDFYSEILKSSETGYIYLVETFDGMLHFDFRHPHHEEDKKLIESKNSTKMIVLKADNHSDLTDKFNDFAIGKIITKVHFYEREMAVGIIYKKEEL